MHQAPYPVHVRLPGVISLLLLLLLSTNSMAQQRTVSRISLPFSFPLSNLYQAAEEQVPEQTGSWRHWRKWNGLDVRYQAWRGPLSLQMQGDVLTVQAHVRYWLQVRKRLIAGFNPTMDCGVDEAPRQAVIGLQLRMGWNPDWTPRPQFRVLPTQFIDRCQMSLINIDVSPLIGRMFQQEIKHSLRQALADLRGSMQAIRGRAGEIWQQLNQPVELAHGTRLHLNPVAAALSPVRGQQGQGYVHLGLAMYPQISTGEAVQRNQARLPPLQTYYPADSGLSFDLKLAIDYPTLSDRLSTWFERQEYLVEERRFGIRRVQVSAADQGLNIKLQLDGQAEGDVDILAKPGFDPEQKVFVIEELDYVFEPVDDKLYMMANLFYEKIRQSLIDGANQILREQLDGAGERLRGLLQQTAPAGVVADVDSLQLTRAGIDFTPQGLNLTGRIEGVVRLQ